MRSLLSETIHASHDQLSQRVIFNLQLRKGLHFDIPNQEQHNTLSAEDSVISNNN